MPPVRDDEGNTDDVSDKEQPGSRGWELLWSRQFISSDHFMGIVSVS